jgi:hypothetical protein
MAGGYEDLIKKYAGDLDPRVIAARIRVESGGNPNVTAKPQQWQTGYGSEIGLLQMSPDTRKQYGISKKQAKDPETNIGVQSKQWNAWARSFFGKAKPQDPVAYNTWAWLTTSIGPGAVRKVRDLTGGDYSLGKLAKVADPKLLSKYRGYWGSQSPQKVAYRIKSAIKNVTRAMAKPVPATHISSKPKTYHQMRAGVPQRSATMAGGKTLSGSLSPQELKDIIINTTGEYSRQDQQDALDLLKQHQAREQAESLRQPIYPGFYSRPGTAEEVRQMKSGLGVTEPVATPKPVAEDPLTTLPGRLAPKASYIDDPPPVGLSPDIGLTDLNKLIGRVADMARAEQNPQRKQKLVKKLRELQVWRLRYSGPHQPAGGTARKYRKNRPKDPAHQQPRVSWIGPQMYLSPRTARDPGVEKEGPVYKNVDIPATPPPAIGGVGSGAPQKILLSSGATTRTGYDPSADLAAGRREVRAGLKEEREAYEGTPTERGYKERRVKLGEAQIEQARKQKTEANKIYDDANKAIDRYIADVNEQIEKIPLEAIQTRLDASSQELQRAKNEIKNFDLQPTMSAGKTIAFSIAAAFSGFAAGFRGSGGNIALQMMSKYMDNQFAVKKAKLNKLKDVYNLTKQQRDYLDKAFTAYKNEYKALMLRRSQLEAAKFSNRSKKLDVKMQMSKFILGVGRELADMDYKAKSGLAEAKRKALAKQRELEVRTKLQAAPKTVTSWKEVVPKDPGRGTQLKPKVIADAMDDLTVLRQMKRLATRVKGKNLTPVKEMLGIFGTDAGKILPQVRAMARMIGRHQGVDKGNFAEKEGRVMVEAITGKSYNKAAQSYKRLMELYNDSAIAFANKVKGWGAAGYDISPFRAVAQGQQGTSMQKVK